MHQLLAAALRRHQKVGRRLLLTLASTASCVAVTACFRRTGPLKTDVAHAFAVKGVADVTATAPVLTASAGCNGGRAVEARRAARSTTGLQLAIAC